MLYKLQTHPISPKSSLAKFPKHASPFLTQLGLWYIYLSNLDLLEAIVLKSLRSSLRKEICKRIYRHAIIRFWESWRKGDVLLGGVVFELRD